MKWNIWLGLVTSVTVFFALGVPLWLQMKNAAVQYSAPPGAAFLLAIPYAIASGVAVFLVCLALQTQLKI
jgi:hypothetical protein